MTVLHIKKSLDSHNQNSEPSGKAYALFGPQLSHLKMAMQSCLLKDTKLD